MMKKWIYLVVMATISLPLGSLYTDYNISADDGNFTIATGANPVEGLSHLPPMLDSIPVLWPSAPGIQQHGNIHIDGTVTASGFVGNGSGLTGISGSGGGGAGDGHSLDAADGSPKDVVSVDNTGNVNIGPAAVLTNNIDFNTESNYTQEDGINGTDFIGGAVKLHDVGGNSVMLIEPWTVTLNGSTVTRTGNIYDVSYSATTSGPVLDYTQTLSNNFDIEINVISSTKTDIHLGRIQLGSYVDASNFVNLELDEGQVPPIPNEGRLRGQIGAVDFSLPFTVSNQTYPKMLRLARNGTTVNGYIDNILVASKTGFPTAIVRPKISFNTNVWSGTITYKFDLAVSATSSSYPTAQAYYIHTSTGSQIDTAGWADINSITTTQVTPASISLKYLVSFDGRLIWKAWNGAAWIASSLANLQVDGMSKATLEAITLAQWKAAGGFAPGTTVTLDFVADLLTTDSSVTPSLDQITVKYFASNLGTLYIDYNSGNVGIGTVAPAGKLDVDGSIFQRGTQLHADYVFDTDYNMEPISEHAEFMWKNKHLKSIPKARLDEKGREIVEIGAYQKGIVEELEKAHIYIDQLHQHIKEMKETFESRLTRLEKYINTQKEM